MVTHWKSDIATVAVTLNQGTNDGVLGAELKTHFEMIKICEKQTGISYGIHELANPSKMS